MRRAAALEVVELRKRFRPVSIRRRPDTAVAAGLKDDTVIKPIGGGAVVDRRDVARKVGGRVRNDAVATIVCNGSLQPNRRPFALCPTALQREQSLWPK